MIPWVWIVMAWLAIADAVADSLAPDADDYAEAAAAIRVERAQERLLALERAIQERDAMFAATHAWLERERQAELMLLDSWAAYVQARAGQHRQSIVPGHGWHEVRR